MAARLVRIGAYVIVATLLLAANLEFSTLQDHIPALKIIAWGSVFSVWAARKMGAL